MTTKVGLFNLTALVSLLFLVVFFLVTAPKQTAVTETAALAEKRTVRVSIIIDDMGYSLKAARNFFALPSALTFAVLPNAPHAATVAREAHQHGHQVIVHLPMEPEEKKHLPKDGLEIEASTAQLARLTQKAFRRVPFAIGFNNHMGSAFTANHEVLSRFLPLIDGQRYFLVDSRTTPKAHMAAVGSQTGLSTLNRDIFLDHDKDPQLIEKQMKKLIATARRQGQALGIGHPYPETLAILKSYLLGREKPKDWLLVPTSQLLFN